MSATAGWYPDPGGGQGLYRYWDGQAWSAATTSNPSSPPPAQGLVNPASATGSVGSSAHANYPQGAGQPSWGQGSYGGSSAFGAGTGSTGGLGGSGSLGGSDRAGQSAPGAAGQPAYAQFQSKRRSGVGWWVGAGALLLVIVVVAVFAIRAATGGGGGTGTAGNGEDTSEVCPKDVSPSASPSASAPAADGRVHGGPVSYPQLGSPWSPPSAETRVPFGVDVLTQEVLVEQNYAGDGQSNWVASVLVGGLQAGDGFFTPEQGSQIVVRCILGKFYGDNPVKSDVKVNQAATIDGHDAWIVESQLSFDIKGLQTKGELLIVAIVATGGERSGLFYASIPDTTPQLVDPARNALKQLTVDG